MRRNKGFTLIELMVVILIVAILAAVLAPMMTGRIKQAKWTEGKAGAGTIATNIRAYCAEKGNATAIATMDGTAGAAFVPIGLTDGDLQGKYFNSGCYGVTGVAYDSDIGIVQYTITITAPATVDAGATRTLTSSAAGVVAWSDE